MDLVRSILMQVEAAQRPIDSGELDCLGKSPDEVLYHIEIMCQRGLIDAKLNRAWGGDVTDCTVSGLTWDGRDYLDAMRDARVWSRAKRAIADSVGSTTFDVVKRVCVAVATKMALEAVG